MRTKVFKIPTSHPGDTSEVEKLVDSGAFQPADTVAIMGKTEGNGCVNDFSRGFAVLALSALYSRLLGIELEEVGDRIAFIMSGGTEGVLSPHLTVFVREESGGSGGGSPRLAIGAARTRDLLPEEIGRSAQLQETSNAVQKAMEQAGIGSERDVHFVQVKCPLLTAERIGEATARGEEVVTHDTYESMGYSRGASALGIALATGDVGVDQLDDERICTDWELFSSVASTSAGVELLHNEILVMGNSSEWEGDLVIGHDVMVDAIDADAVKRALANAGVSFDWRPSQEQTSGIVNIFAKAEADPSGQIRGRRHTMLDDSDINHSRHARAAVGATVASIVGDPMVYVSGGSEHQGPPGGGPIAAIVRASPDGSAD